MAEKYDISNFTVQAIPNQYSRDIKDLCMLAVSMGWTLFVTSGTAMRLVSPKSTTRGEKVIQLNTSKKSHPLDQYRRWVTQYANPLLAPVAGEKKAEAKAQQMLRAIERRSVGEAKRVVTEVTGVEPKSGVDAIKTAQHLVEAAVTVVYEGPMRSKGVDGHYESDIATEVEFSDKTRLFTCTRCDYQNSKPPAMAGHWRKHVYEDERNKGGHVGDKAAYTPNPERLDSLKATLRDLLKKGLDWADIDGSAETLAYTALQWEWERHQGDGTERAPLTDAQMLDRIRRLVDGGRYDEQQRELREQRDRIEELMAANEKREIEWGDEMLRLTAERDAARSNLNTLRELIDGLGE